MSFSPRPLLKRAFEFFYSNLPDRIPDGSSLILAYHNIVAPEHVGLGDRSLHLSEKVFEKQIRAVLHEADIVSLPELINDHGKRGKRIAVTFDDAYSGCILRGIPICASHGVRPTVFVAPSLLGTYAIWDIRAQQGLWSYSNRSEFLDQDQGIAARYSVSNYSQLPQDFRIASVQEIQTALHDYQFDIGNHTLRHSNLSRLEQSEITSEVTEAQTLLMNYFPHRVVPFLAYPYGYPPDSSILTTSLPNPITGALVVNGGWILSSQEPDSFLLPRLNIPSGLSARRLQARLRGWQR